MSPTRRAPISPVHPLLLALLAIVCLPLASCGGGGGGGEPAPVEAEPTRIEDQELGIAVVVPPGSRFEPIDSAAGEIRLRFAGDREFTPGTVIYDAEPVQYFGVDLVEAVNVREEDVESRPGGEFHGQVELGSHLGTAFSTRARYDDESGEQVEEVRIYAVHPSGDRLFHMTYRYAPAPGQTEARMMDQAFEAFGYVEGLAPPEAAPESAPESAGEGSEAEPESR